MCRPASVRILSNRDLEATEPIRRREELARLEALPALVHVLEDVFLYIFEPLSSGFVDVANLLAFVETYSRLGRVLRRFEDGA